MANGQNHHKIQVVRIKSSYRDYIRERVGLRGERIFDVLADIMDGKPWVPKLPDGREARAVIPTTADRLKAALELRDTLIGKPVLSSEILKSEAAGAAQEEIRNLGDEELAARAREALRRLEASSEVDAEIVHSPQEPSKAQDRAPVPTGLLAKFRT